MIGSVVAGRYQLERKAGSGGMGAVYRARDLAVGNIVAVKLLTSQEVRDEKRFAQEAEILAGLSHPAIVRYIGHGTASGLHFLVMEWLEGEDLLSYIERQPVPIAETLALVQRSAEALLHAHQKGIIHRDIKPQNFFLADKRIERAKILDFGIARLAHNAPRLTRTGTLVGTPGYLPPEIIQGTRAFDGRADMFALGCVAFECLTGRPAYEGSEPSTLLAKIVLDEPPRLRDVAPHVPEAISDLIGRMMLKDPTRRLDAAGVVAALQALGKVADGPGAPVKPVRRPTMRLTIGEQRIGCIVMVGVQAAGTPAVAHGLQLELNSTFKCTLHPMPDGTLVLNLPSAGTRSADQPTMAARCALVLRDRVPDVPIVVASGIGRFSEDVPRGPVIDAGVRLLKVTPRGHVRLDNNAASLVGSRFEIHREEGAVFLRRERELFEPKRNLLGKPALFVGRGQELSSLAGVFTDAMTEGTAAAVLVTGSAGIGKSRLLHEFLEWVHKREEETAILYGLGDSLSAGAPFAMLGQAIRRYAGIKETEPLEERQKKLAVCVAKSVAPETQTQVTMFLAEIAHAAFPDSEHEALRAARANPQLMADATRRAFEDWLKAETSAHPVLLVLEDLHWGDSGTVSFIDSALRNLRDMPFMVVAMARPEITESFPNLWAERRRQVVQLGPLSRKASEKMVRDALAPSVTDTLVADLVARADGNPFYLEELIRAAHEGRVEDMPHSVLGMVQVRLDAEGDDAKRVLRAGSIFGDRFSGRSLAALLGGKDELPFVVDWLEQLTEREILIRASFSSGASEPEFAFGHALIREAAYSTLTDEDRVLGHRLAGLWLEDTGYTEAMVMAEHFRRGQTPDRAAPWYRRAAEQALKANDLAGAVARGRLGLDALDEPAWPPPEGEVPRPLIEPPEETRGAVWLSMAEAYLWRGELAPAQEAGSAALVSLASESALWFRAAGQTIIALGKQGKVDRLEELVERVRGMPYVEGARDAFVICLGWAASYLITCGRYEASGSVIEQAVALASTVGEVDPQAVALIHQAQFARASIAGDWLSGLDHLEAARAAFDQAGDLRNICAVQSNMGFFYAELGDLERAETALRESLAVADRLGLSEMTAVVLHNLGHVIGWRGDLRDAEKLERTAIEAFQKQGEPRLEGLARVYLSEILVTAGNVAEAQEHAEIAVRLLHSAPAVRVLAQTAVARALLGRGDPDGAMIRSGEAYQALEELGSIEEGEAIVRLVHAECLAANGRAADAQKVLAGARDSLLQRASRLGERTWRDYFLKNVPAHARTIALADEWLAGAAINVASSSEAGG